VQHLATILAGSVQRAPWGWALLVTAVIALWRGWPAISDATTRALVARKAEKRLDALSRIIALESKVENYQAQMLALERQSNTALMAYRLIAGELARLDPDNPILRQAQQLLGMASAKVKTGNAGLDDFLSSLDVVPGIGEE
jgi:hypothetical protein